MTEASQETHTRRIEASAVATREALARAAEGWGATFQPGGDDHGRLELPVNAGLRQGRLFGTVRWHALGAASSLRFDVDRQEYELAKPAVGLLLSGGVGAISALLWPFFPSLIKIAPFGALIAVGVWFLVLAKVRYVGVEVFLDRVADEAEGDSPGRE